METDNPFDPMQFFDAKKMDDNINRYSYPVIDKYIGKDALNYEKWAVAYLQRARASGKVSPIANGTLMAICRTTYSKIRGEIRDKDIFLARLNELAENEKSENLPEIWDFEDYVSKLNSPIKGEESTRLSSFADKFPATFLQYLCNDLSDQRNGIKDGTLRFMWGITDQSLFQDIPDPRIADGQDYHW